MRRRELLRHIKAICFTNARHMELLRHIKAKSSFIVRRIDLLLRNKAKGTCEPTMFLKETYFGSISLFHFRRRIGYNALLRYQSPCFELPLSNQGSKRGLSQAEQGKRYLGKAEAQVYMITYTRTYNVSARNIVGSLCCTFQVSFRCDAD